MKNRLNSAYLIYQKNDYDFNAEVHLEADKILCQARQELVV